MGLAANTGETTMNDMESIPNYEAVKRYFMEKELPLDWAIDIYVGQYPLLMVAFPNGKIRWARLSPEKRLYLLEYFGTLDTINAQAFREKYNFWMDAPSWRFPSEEEEE
jgi:hypothetical protein